MLLYNSAALALVQRLQTRQTSKLSIMSPASSKPRMSHFPMGTKASSTIMGPKSLLNYINTAIKGGKRQH